MDMTQAQMKKLTPEKYLSKGFCAKSGKARHELVGLFATAASGQLLEAEVSPQELKGVLEALKIVLPLYKQPAEERITLVVDEAIQTAAMRFRQPVNPGIRAWLRACAAKVTSDKDIEALLGHFEAVVRQYAAVVAFTLAKDQLAEEEEPA